MKLTNCLMKLLFKRNELNKIQNRNNTLLSVLNHLQQDLKIHTILTKERTKYYNSHRCVKYRLGCVPGQLEYPRKLDSVGVNSSHQYSGTEGNSVLHSRVQRASESNDIDSNRQHDVCSLYQPSERDDISGSLKDRREFVDIMSETHSKVDSGTHSRHKKCGSGSSIKDNDRKKRMEVTSQNLQRIQQDMGSLSIGSICKQNQHPTSPLLCMEILICSNEILCPSSPPKYTHFAIHSGNCSLAIFPD
ncbi:unnamed protein product [Rhizophagus irregularis]|nr:unnamed protein product [Rhizophagus irregularis]